MGIIFVINFPRFYTNEGREEGDDRIGMSKKTTQKAGNKETSSSMILLDITSNIVKYSSDAVPRS